MTDFKSRDPNMSGPSDKILWPSVFITRKVGTERLFAGDPYEKVDWANDWRGIFADRIKKLRHDDDHSYPSEMPASTNPTRAEIVAVYEGAYSELVEILKQFVTANERARANMSSLEGERDWLREELIATGADRIKHQERVEILLDLLAKGRLAEDRDERMF